MQSLDGELRAISGLEIDVIDGNAKSHKLRVSTAASKIMISGQPAELSNLRPGMSCSLRYLNEGDVAETIACK